MASLRRVLVKGKKERDDLIKSSAEQRKRYVCIPKREHGLFVACPHAVAYEAQLQLHFPAKHTFNAFNHAILAAPTERCFKQSASINSSDERRYCGHRRHKTSFSSEKNKGRHR